jgi:acyl carrier protein
MSAPSPTSSVVVQRAEILERVRQLAAESAGVAIEAVGPESELERDLGMDSLTRIEFAMAVEEAYGLELSDEVAEKIQTVADATAAVTALLKV